MINLLITDFDGTLVDTFEANFHAYTRAFSDVGVNFTRTDYQRCFGYRFDRFMDEMNIMDEHTRLKIRELKGIYYPEYFHLLKINTALLDLLDSFHKAGKKTAIASTARKKNLMNVLNYIGVSSIFDVILAGENVSEGKPSPEIYLNVMNILNMNPEETLIFEDSDVGIKAAQQSGAQYLKIIL